MNDDIRVEAERFAARLENEVSRLNRLAGLDGRADEAWQAMYDELAERPLSVDLVRRVDVLIGTGGPACGVTFDMHPCAYGWAMTAGRVWWQDWGTPKMYADLDEDAAQTLFDLWGCENL